jgi:polyhydroxyalkanoate synthesis regulator protein
VRKAAEKPTADATSHDEIAALREQMAAMQKKLDELSK